MRRETVRFAMFVIAVGISLGAAQSAKADPRSPVYQPPPGGGGGGPATCVTQHCVKCEQDFNENGQVIQTCKQVEENWSCTCLWDNGCAPYGDCTYTP